MASSQTKDIFDGHKTTEGSTSYHNIPHAQYKTSLKGNGRHRQQGSHVDVTRQKVYLVGQTCETKTYRTQSKYGDRRCQGPQMFLFYILTFLCV